MSSKSLLALISELLESNSKSVRNKLKQCVKKLKKTAKREKLKNKSDKKLKQRQPYLKKKRKNLLDLGRLRQSRTRETSSTRSVISKTLSNTTSKPLL